LAAPTGVVVEIPARFSIFATALDCPCGLNNGLCRCQPERLAQFRDRVARFATTLREVAP
jgi:hypothetical protein